MRFPGRPRVLFAVLVAAVMGAAVAAVYAKHESRKLFMELQALTEERDRLEVDWSRLQIEQSTWSTHARVEQLARGEMRMRSPGSDEVRLANSAGGSLARPDEVRLANSAPGSGRP
jgi:cell division protein FtsL